ncbi:peptidoglycan binding domain-containing protein [Saccharomonospora azurea]|uniref:Vancomycin resistance protein n=1 Tax=Saccharomonospora azurea NA-128 TaxID=882081 RepID=H8G9M9_9PSEU|nr:peptidoglycan binding domain-containing protein [Saccharomonospora azurea]EHY89561.1 putative vancomycin resistance protein [Saccharomonospora azurea NA-128]
MARPDDDVDDVGDVIDVDDVDDLDEPLGADADFPDPDDLDHPDYPDDADDTAGDVGYGSYVDDPDDEPFADDLDAGFAPTEEAPTWVVPDLRWRRRLGNALVALGALTGLLAIVYVVDLLTEFGDVPRGVTVAGVDIGGLDRDEAQDLLRRDLGPLVQRAVELRAGEVEASFDPAEAGLGVDWAATVERAGGQPWSPWDRITSLFGGREVPLVTTVDDHAVRVALGRLAQERINRPAVDGGIAFRPSGDADGGVEPYAIEPRAGLRLSDLGAAVSAVRAHWPSARPVDVPFEVVRPTLTREAVHSVLDGTVRPLLAGPILLRGDGGESVLLPEDVRKALAVEVRARPDVPATLAVTLDDAVLRGAVQGELGRTERPARDAALLFRGGIPEVVPSVPGVRIDWERTFAGLVEHVSTAPADQRRVDVLYQPVEPSVSTQDVQALGITDVVGTASTTGHSPAELGDVNAVLATLNGVLVLPGEVFDVTAYAPTPPWEGVLRDALRQAGLDVRDGQPVTNDTGTAIAVHASATGSTVRATVWGTPS